MDQVTMLAEEDAPSVFQFFMSVSHLYRTILDVIADQIEVLGISDLNPVQVILLCGLGDNTVPAGGLRKRGYYSGSNATYNLKHLVTYGYVSHVRNEVDRRMVAVSLTDKGRDVRSCVLSKLDRMQRTMLNFQPLRKEIDLMNFKLNGTIRHIR